MKKIVLGIIFTCLIGIAGCTIAMVVLDKDNSGISSNSQNNNYNNDSNEIKDTNDDNFVGNGIKNNFYTRIAYKGNNGIYYMDYVNDKKIAKLNSNGSNRSHILNLSTYILFEKNNYLYVTDKTWVQGSIYFIDLNKDNTNLSLNEYQNNKIINSANYYVGLINNDIYFNAEEEIVDKTDEYGFTSESHNETSLYLYKSDVEKTLLKKDIYRMFEYKNKIYYTKTSYSSNYETGLFVTDLNFTNETKVISNDVIEDFVIHNDNIYYKKSSGNLFKSDINGNNEIKLIDEYVEEFQMTDNSIFYKIDTSDALYKIDINAKNEKKKIADRVFEYDLIDDYIYYVGYSDKGPETFRMKNDGTKIESMTI